MGKCNIDHSHEDVMKKFQKQKELLPETVVGKIDNFLDREKSQGELNDLFHLLKKYDLATEEERKVRNKKLAMLLE